MRHLLLIPILSLTLALPSTPEALANPPAPSDALLVPAELAPPATADVPSTTPPAPDPVEDPSAYAKAVADAVKGGKWLVLAGLLLVALIAFMRHVVFGKVDWFKTKRGGLVLAAGTSFLVTMGVALAGGQSIGWQLLAACVTAGAAAIGLFTGTKDAKAAPRKQPPPVPLRSAR